MPFGLGKCVIFGVHWSGVGFVGVNMMGVVGRVSKRKIWRIGPKCPKGSIAKGISTMLRSRRSPMMVLPVVVVPVVESVLLLRLILFFFRISVDVNWHWLLILL